jgi:hypothetical protein
MTAADISAQLCVGCGMCCDGVLYDRAKVDPGEEASMTAAGLDLFEKGGKTFFRQPCPHSSCGRCMIYETRFHICHSYECALLRRVEDGELGLGEAKEKIAGAQRLLTKVVATDPEARNASSRAELRARLAKELGEHGVADRRTISRRLLDIIALDSYLERWFRLRSEKESRDEKGTEPTMR